MSKNIRLTIFLDMKDYLELINEAKINKIKAKNDSELIRKIIMHYLKDAPLNILQIEQLKIACQQKNAVIEQLRSEKKK